MKIAIIGLGFAGGALALLMERQGATVEIFESAANPGPVGAGILLQPSGQAVLDSLGLLEPSLRISQRMTHLRARNQRGRQFLDLPLDNRTTYGIHRGQIFQQLWDALQGSSVALQCGQPVTDVDPAGWIEAGGQRKGPYDLVVLADGSRSRLRSRVCQPLLEHSYSIGALWYGGQSRFPGDHLYQVSQGSRRLCGLLPTGAGGCSLFWSCTRAEFEGYRGGAFRDWSRQVRNLAPEASELLDGLDPSLILFSGYRHHWLPRWYRDKLVLIGDCAHPMSPHLGQGANLALLDAYSLARSCVQAPSQPLARYQRIRQSHVILYSGLSLLLTPFFQSRVDLVQSLGRDLVLPWMLRWPWMVSQMREAVYGQKGGWLTGWQGLDDLT